MLALTGTAVATLALVPSASAAARPDLVVSELASPATTKVAGHAITVSTTVRNRGTARPEVASRVRYYLSSDRVRGDDRKLAGYLSTPRLAPGASRSAEATLTIPAATPSASYYVIACADGTSLVRESREGNNCRATSEQVEVVAAQSDLMAFADDDIAGDNVANAAWAHFVEQHTVTVRNHGPAPAPNAQVQVFFEPSIGLRNYSAPAGVTCTPGYPVVCDLGTLGVGIDNDIDIDFDVRWRSYGAQSVSPVTSSDFEDPGPNDDISRPIEVKELTEGSSITPINNSTQGLDNSLIYGLRAALLGDQNDPLNTLVKLNGTIDPAGDVDWYRFIVPAGGDVTLETFDGNGSDCTIDTVISLHSQAGAELATSDDDGTNFCSRIAPDTHPAAGNLAEGNYWVRIRHFAADKTILADPGYELQGTITP